MWGQRSPIVFNAYIYTIKQINELDAHGSCSNLYKEHMHAYRKIILP